jgi:excisionase family DNA binding protein
MVTDDAAQAEALLTDDDQLLTPADVAAVFRVDPRTVTRWAIAGRIQSVRTPGGHRRFRRSSVLALLAAGAQETATALADEEAATQS